MLFLFKENLNEDLFKHVYYQQIPLKIKYEIFLYKF